MAKTTTNEIENVGDPSSSPLNVDKGTSVVVPAKSGEQPHVPSDGDFSHFNKPVILSKVPLSDKTKRTAEEISKAVIEKYFKSWKNESNLDMQTVLVMTIYFSNSYNASASVQAVLGDKLSELVIGTLTAIKFKNDNRAKSVISLLADTETKIPGVSNLSYRDRYKAITGILRQHPAINPLGKPVEEDIEDGEEDLDNEVENEGQLP